MKRIPPDNLNIKHIYPDKMNLQTQIVDETPVLALSVGSALLNLFSQHYQSKYGVGIVEWRIMTTLRNDSGTCQKDICNTLAADKAAVSRALTKLKDKRLIAGKNGQWSNRRKYWQLTPAGLALHNVILNDTRKINQVLLKDIPSQQILTTYHMFQQLQANIRNYTAD